MAKQGGCGEARGWIWLSKKKGVANQEEGYSQACVSTKTSYSNGKSCGFRSKRKVWFGQCLQG